MKTAILVLFLLGLVPANVNVEIDEPDPVRVQDRYLDKLTQTQEQPKTLEEVEVPEKKEEETEEVEEEIFPTQQDVRFTVYYPNDGTGSTNSTSLGDNIDDFYEGPYGLAMHDGKAVIATATYGCANSSTDECGSSYYLPLPSEFHIFQEYQELTLVIMDGGEEVRIPAQVRDACGACFWHEDEQRVDLLVKSTSGFRFDGWIEY